jgi:hypothetical protein
MVVDLLVTVAEDGVLQMEGRLLVCPTFIIAR